MVAQFSNGRIQLGGLFNGLKVNTDTYKDTINQFKALNLDSRDYKISNTTTFDWDAIAASIEISGWSKVKGIGSLPIQKQVG